ncbi:MAG: DUF2480 family protein [candidate division Zixibacteria bacterium]
MSFSVIDPAAILADDGFTEASFNEARFTEAVDRIDWKEYNLQNVLIRGCDSVIIPTWAYMVIAVRLSCHARSVRFGNEHSFITVFRKENRERLTEKEADKS